MFKMRIYKYLIFIALLSIWFALVKELHKTFYMIIGFRNRETYFLFEFFYGISTYTLIIITIYTFTLHFINHKGSIIISIGGRIALAASLVIFINLFFLMAKIIKYNQVRGDILIDASQWLIPIGSSVTSVYVIEIINFNAGVLVNKYDFTGRLLGLTWLICFFCKLITDTILR